MIKVGDRVKFLNDIGGGVVTGFVNKNLVNVENEDGFEIPYPVSQLINVDAPELNTGAIPETDRKEENKEAPQMEKRQEEGRTLSGKDAPDFYFCIVPEDAGNPMDNEIKLYLVNDSNFTVVYHFSYVKQDHVSTIKFGPVQPNARIQLESLTRNDITDLPEFGFQLIYFKEGEKELNTPFSKVFKVNPVKFYKESSFHSNIFFPGNAILLKITPNVLTTEIDKLTRDDFKKVIREKEARTIPAKKVIKRRPDIIEVDLHINQLLDSSEGLSNREILGIQMDKVKSEMQSAIREGASKIVFIHGVGQGVLKEEMSKLLRSGFKKYPFQDASFREYGYGATMVTLKGGNR